MFREIGCGSLTSRKRFGTALFAALVSILPVVSNPVAAEVLTPQQQLAFDIYKELVEINTVTATGDTASAAEAMAARLRAAGFADADVHMFSPAPHKGNLVARHGRDARSGMSLKPDESARAAAKPPRLTRSMQASAPPQIAMSASPARIRRAASPIACTLAAQAVTGAPIAPSNP